MQCSVSILHSHVIGSPFIVSNEIGVLLSSFVFRLFSQAVSD